MLPFEALEIHKVFLRPSKLALRKNLSLSTRKSIFRTVQENTPNGCAFAPAASKSKGE